MMNADVTGYLVWILSDQLGTFLHVVTFKPIGKSVWQWARLADETNFWPVSVGTADYADYKTAKKEHQSSNLQAPEKLQIPMSQ